VAKREADRADRQFEQAHREVDKTSDTIMRATERLLARTSRLDCVARDFVVERLFRSLLHELVDGPGRAIRSIRRSLNRLEWTMAISDTLSEASDYIKQCLSDRPEIYQEHRERLEKLTAEMDAIRQELDTAPTQFSGACH
jgi:hypothetical protein